MTITIPDSIFNTNIDRLTNQLWKLIPMRENQEDWLSQLNTVFIEIVGLGKLFPIIINENFLILLSKIKGLRLEEDIDFQTYRKTVFECISLLREMRL